MLKITEHKKKDLGEKRKYKKPKVILTKISVGVWGGSGTCCGSCLSPLTKISTLDSSVAVEKIKVGDSILSTDNNGNKLNTRVIKTSKIRVASTHKVIDLRLSDGRKLQVSPDHPGIGNRNICQLQKGERYDRSTILDINLIRYKYKYTYDILPEGPTGYYWANNILIGSTLSPKELNESSLSVKRVLSLVEVL